MAAASLRRLAGYTRAAGRQPGEIGIEARLTLAGIPAARRAEFACRWGSLGATHLAVDTMGAGLGHAANHVAALRETIHALRAAGI